MQLSIVIPVYNENESLPELVSWIDRVTNLNQIESEIILIDDGSNDGSWLTIKQLREKYPQVKGVLFGRNYGKAAALHSGFNIAAGNTVITMDADLQDSPDEIPALLSLIESGNYDLISGWKKKRYDPITKTLPSKLYNGVVRWFTGIPLHDFNCGLKAYRGKVVKNIEIYGDMHRYIPVLAKKAGFKRIGEKEVHHYKRKYGESKYGWGRMKGMLDIISIIFISKYGKKPMHLFGSFGTLMFILGATTALGLGIRKLYFVSQHVVLEKVTENAFFYISLTAMILGAQFFIAGFLGELITRNSTERNNYIIEEKI